MGSVLIVECKDYLKADSGKTEIQTDDVLPAPCLTVTFGESILEYESRLDSEHTDSNGQPGVSGSVTFQGNSLPLPGGAIELNGVGERFNGTMIVTGVEHVIQKGDWLTTTKFG